MAGFGIEAVQGPRASDFVLPHDEGGFVMKKILIAAAVIMMVSALGGIALAAGTTTVNVSANIVGTCQFSTTPTLAFGALDQTSGAPATATGTLSFWCTKGAAYTLSDPPRFHRHVLRLDFQRDGHYCLQHWIYQCDGQRHRKDEPHQFNFKCNDSEYGLRGCLRRRLCGHGPVYDCPLTGCRRFTLFNGDCRCRPHTQTSAV